MTLRATTDATDAVIAIDIGGTTLKGAVLTASGRVLTRKTVATFSVNDDAYAGVAALVDVMKRDTEAAGFTSAGIGLASPGLVDSDTGVIEFAANLRWASLPLRGSLEERFGLPVAIDHDARAGARAERTAHAADHIGFRNFLFIPIGTGVAAAVYAAGVPIIGSTGSAGEFGHIPVVPHGDLCGCGQHGCIEAYASASSILGRYQQFGGTALSSSSEIAAHLDDDPIAARVWNDAVEALAIGVTAVTAVLDPAFVVVGGGLSNSGEILLTPLRASVEAHLGWRTTPQIIQSVLGSHAGLVGAALIAWGDRPIPDSFAVDASRLLGVSEPFTVQIAPAVRLG